MFFVLFIGVVGTLLLRNSVVVVLDFILVLLCFDCFWVIS